MIGRSPNSTPVTTLTGKVMGNYELPQRNIQKEMVDNTIVVIKDIEEEKAHLNTLKREESKAFIELGKKLDAVDEVLKTANNVHKSIRTNIVSAMALYRQLRECREAITINPLLQASRETHAGNESGSVEGGYKRPPSISPTTSPKQRRVIKKPRTVTIAPDLEYEQTIVEVATPMEENRWEKVQHRKTKRKKNSNTNKKTRAARETGEAIAIKADSETYAEVIKKMKNAVNPSDIGVEINGMRRTRTGEILVKFRKGEGQADKMKEALTRTLGEDITIRSVVRNQTIDIRDMDETTDGQELINALMRAAGVQQDTLFKILNIRESFGKTRQALVQMPVNLATKLLKEGKITIGWVRCRVRPKLQSAICFRCLDRGHRARECKGEDRTRICRKCCRSGHLSRDCKQAERCILCQEAGLENIDHLIGSALCCENRRKLTKT